MTNTKTKFPQFYLIDFETYVKIELIGDEVTGVNQYGNPYPPYKALDGQQITETDYNDAVKSAKRVLQS